MGNRAFFTLYLCRVGKHGCLLGWLLKYNDMKIRCDYHSFLDKVDHYFERLFKEIVLLKTNEDGGYGIDKVYLEVCSYDAEKQSNGSFCYKRWIMRGMLANGSSSAYAHPAVNCGSDLKNQMQKLQKSNQKKPADGYGILDRLV